MSFGQVHFTHWVIGDSSDVETVVEPGVVLAGGGQDHDDAMRWMLKRAGGGDVVVIRASGSDGYNPYFFSELGVSVNSVETIRFDGAEASADPYVIRQIRNAELLFIAGGDQYVYYRYWKDQEIEHALQYLVEEKGITIGGTSAGMAIMAEYYYAPSDLGIISSEALSNPYHPFMEVLGMSDFLQIPILENTITDTHFDQCGRSGRTTAFMARLAIETGKLVRGIACNEVTAVAIDDQGMARIFGEYPDYDDFAYFIQVNCIPEHLPEQITEGMPLIWDRGQAALKVIRIPGTREGTNTFDLNDWASHSGDGTWGNWFVTDSLHMTWNTGPIDCETTSTAKTGQEVHVSIFPNPVVFESLQIRGFDNPDYHILTRDGKTLFTGRGNTINTSYLEAGLYYLRVFVKEAEQSFPIIKM